MLVMNLLLAAAFSGIGDYNVHDLSQDACLAMNKLDPDAQEH